MTRNLILMAALTLSVFVGQSQAILVTDTSLENVLGDFVRAGDTDDFYGIVDGVEPFTIGGTTITGVNTAPGVGDYLLQSNIGNIISGGTVLAKLDVTAGSGQFLAGTATFSFLFDEQGRLENGDQIRYQIYDPIGGSVLNWIQTQNNQNNSPTDKPKSVSADVTGLSVVEARIVYWGGFNTAKQDGEEIQISAYSLSANVVPEPATALLGMIGVAGLAMRRRRLA